MGGIIWTVSAQNGIYSAEARWDDVEENRLVMAEGFVIRADIEASLFNWVGGGGADVGVFLHYANSIFGVKWVLVDDSATNCVMEITSTTTGAVGRGSTLADLLVAIDEDNIFVPDVAVEFIDFIDSEEDLDLDGSDDDLDLD
tara:strand:+ start:509 stop:937 length:429 start_codon:yes stop_codon:yes gene_type:complete